MTSNSREILASALFERAEMSYTEGIPKKSEGEGGYGIYAYPSTSASLRNYYSANGETLIAISPKPGARIVDLTTLAARKEILEESKKLAPSGKTSATLLTVHRYPWAIRAYLHKQSADAYLLIHEGNGIPTGKQLVIINEDAFSFVKANAKHESTAQGGNNTPTTHQV